MKNIIITGLTLALTAPMAFAASESEARQSAPQEKSQQPATTQQSGAQERSNWDQKDKDKEHKDAYARGEKEKDKSERQWSSDRNKTSMKHDSVKAVSRDQISQQSSLNDLVDSDVVDQQDESIGSISDVAMEDGEITDVFVSVGGILGIGGDLVRVPFEALEETQIDGEKAYKLNVSADQITDLGENETVDLGDNQQAESVSDQELENLLTADKATGKEVVDRNGETIGTIDSFARQEEKVTGVYLQSDQDFVSGDQLVHIPFDQLQVSQEQGEYRFELDMGSDELASNLEGASREMARTGQSEMNRERERAGTMTTGTTSQRESGQRSTTSRTQMGQQSDSVRTVSRDQVSEESTLDRILDRELLDQEDESIGSISDVAMQDGEITDVYVSVGGVFGIGADLVRIPFEALEETQQDGEQAYRLNVSANQITDLDDNETVDLGDNQQAQMVSREEKENQLTADKAIGSQVTDSAGQNIGTIDSFAFEQERVTGAYLQVNDEQLASGDELVFVPFDQLQISQSEGEYEYQLDMGQSELASTLRDARDEVARRGQSGISRERDQTRTGVTTGETGATGTTTTTGSTRTGTTDPSGTTTTRTGSTSDRERTMDREGETRVGATGSSAQRGEVERIQSQIDQILAGEQQGEDAPQVNVRQDGDALVLTGHVESLQLEDRILESVREMSDKEVRDYIYVSGEDVAMQ